MKQRFAHFMVAHSRLILIIFIILALGCAVLIPFVPVNEDMTKYLPKDSAMRHGLDLMEAEFGDEDSSSLEVMFDDLENDQARGQVLQKLEQIPYVDSVDYEFPSDDEDEDYNKDGYTRFIVNCDYEQYSDEASAIWNAVKEDFEENHHIELGGAIHDSNEPGLPVWIVVAGLLSFAFNEPATRQICRILSVGCLIATLLVIFLLPAILSCLDRFVTGRKGYRDSQ